MVTVLEVYDTLSFHVWKSPLDIEYEINEQKRTGNSIWHKASLGSIQYNLCRLVNDDYAEKRKRQLTEEQLKARGGRIGYEYRLTSGGVHRRCELEKKRHIEGLPDFLPT